MSTINFDNLFNDIVTEVASIARDLLKDYENEAKVDARKALHNIKLNLRRWVTELENGTITKTDLRYLLKEEVALNEMIVLKQAGFAAIHIDEFRNNVVNAIVNTITGLIKV